MLVYLLLIAGVASLATGLLLDEQLLVYAAVGLSLAGLALMAFDAWRSKRSARTDDVAEAGDEAGAEHPEDEAEHAQDERPAPLKAARSADESDVVLVVTGRKRYHQRSCSLVSRSEVDEVTVAEAIDEGFTPCSRCAPRRLAAS